MSEQLDEEPSAPTPADEAGDDMHIHKPRAAHSLREFVSEIGVIVVGVLIALALEQAVEAAHWAHKVETVKRSLDSELTEDAAFAYRIRLMRPCEVGSAAVIERALRTGRAELLTRIYSDDNNSNPFDPRPWQDAAWVTAQAGDVTSHLGQETSDAYALAFRIAGTERELQWRLQDDYAEAMSGRLGLDASGRTALLAALERYRATGLTAYQAAGRFLRAAGRVGIGPTAEAMHEVRQEKDGCLARLAAATAGQDGGAR